MVQKALVCSAIAFLALPAFAQTSVPPAADPGVLLRSLESPLPKPQLQSTPLVATPAPRESTGDQRKAFVLQGVEVQGSSLFSAEDFNALYKDLIGQSVSFADLESIAFRVTHLYRDQGYVLSRAYLPEQKVRDGMVQLHVLEGFVDQVVIEGPDKNLNQRIAATAKTAAARKPVRVQDIERALLLINDLQGVTARGVLKPGQRPGASDLVITVARQDWQASLQTDNRAGTYLGDVRAIGDVAINDVPGIGGTLGLRLLSTLPHDEVGFAEMTHRRRLSSNGLDLYMRLHAARTHPSGDLKHFDIKGESQGFTAALLYPLIRTRAQSLVARAEIEFLNSRTKVLGLVSSADRVRTAQMGLAYDSIDTYAGINRIDMALTQGLPFAGASDDGPNRSRANGRNDFLRANLSLARTQHLIGGFSMQAEVKAQLAEGALLASEEFSLGGASFGRGYDSGEISGDHGAAAALELRYGQPSQGVVTYWQAFGFYDIGAVWNDDRVFGEESRSSLASAGFGARFNLEKGFEASVEAAKPLTKSADAKDKDTRLFFSLSKRF